MITKGQWATVARLYPHLSIVPKSFWDALTSEQSTFVKQSLADKGISIGNPSIWLYADNDATPITTDDVGSLPEDYFLVSDDPRWSKRSIIYLQAAVDDPDSIDTLSLQTTKSNLQTVVDAEYDTRFSG